MNYLHISMNDLGSSLLTVTSDTKLFNGWLEPFITHGLTITFHRDIRNTKSLSYTLYTSQPRDGVFHFRNSDESEFIYGEADLRSIYLRNYCVRTRFAEDTRIGHEYVYDLLYHRISKNEFYASIGTGNPDGVFQDYESEEAEAFLKLLGLAFVED